MKIVGFVLAVLSMLLLLLSLTTVFPSPVVILWKLSILASEYGHWFALVVMLLLGLSVKIDGISSWISIGLLGAAFPLFCRPVVQAYLHQSEWKGALRQAFGGERKPLLSFSQLWFEKKIEISPKTLIFSKPDQDKLVLDFYPANSDLPTPWIVVVHAGGWDSGDRKQMTEFNSFLADSGYSVAAISYRLAPAAKWPAQKEDVLTAVAFLKGHAQELGLDATQWVVMGRSAGGQIAEAVAFQSVEDSTLKGVIGFYSPADLNFAFKYSDENDIINSRDLLRHLLGGDPTQVPDQYRSASPIEDVGPASPPTLLLHGAHDALTWCEQSRRLNNRMQQVGAKCVYIEFPWATHAFDFSLKGPAGQVSKNAVKIFLSSVFNSSDDLKRSSL